jgi:hypothetical protein
MQSKAISVKPSLQVRSFAFQDDLRTLAFARVEDDGTGGGRMLTGGTAAMRIAREAEFTAAQPAPKQTRGGQHHDYQGNNGLPVHTGNITGIAARATAIFCHRFPD